MKVENILDAIGEINDEAVLEARTYIQAKTNSVVKWGTLTACFGLILTLALVTLPGILKETRDVVPPFGSDMPEPVVSDDVYQSNADSSQPAEPDTVQVRDTRAETWLTAEELGMAKPEGTLVSGFHFLSWRLLRSCGCRANGQSAFCPL